MCCCVGVGAADCIGLKVDSGGGGLAVVWCGSIGVGALAGCGVELADMGDEAAVDGAVILVFCSVGNAGAVDVDCDWGV